MKTKLLMLIGLALLLAVFTDNLLADDFDGLSDLADEGSVEEVAIESFESTDFDGLSGLADKSSLEDLSSETSEEEVEDEGSEDLVLNLAGDSREDETEGDEISLIFGGYLKTLAYWNQEEYAEMLWGRYQELASYGLPAPDKRKLSGYNNIGTRLQIKLEGYLGDSARLFSAVNINYNMAKSLHDEFSSEPETSNTKVRPIESYIELYEGSRIWRIGPQILTWGYMEGAEVPTDRVNARDQSYKSTEYEDSKIPADGILLTQPIGDVQLELMAIPVSKQNVSGEFTTYLLTGEDEDIERKPNNGKWATRFSGTVGNLDAALSYLEGLDAAPDLSQTETGNGKAYNRIKSPGLDLQYNFGSLLGKVSYVYYQTEDEDGKELLIKNSWSKYAAGTEFYIGSSTVNIYAGQILIENFQTDEESQNKGFLMGQIRKRTDFLSGHVTANFLTGNALSLVLMAAGYWDDEGEPMRSFYKITLNYKISDGLNLLFSPAHSDYMKNKFTDVQAEVKYSF